MKRKLFALCQLAGFYGVLLLLGPASIRSLPNLYVLATLGALAIVFQPSFSSFEGGPAGDRGTARQILWSIMAVQGLAHAESVFLRHPLSFQWTHLAWAGLIAAIAGLLVRTWSVIHLGAAFTWHIDAESADAVVDTGPFALVRHPSYVGAFLLYVGSVVFLGAWFTLGLALLVIPLAFARRIRWEEEALEARFGDDYRAYRARVGAVLPRLPRPASPP